MQVRVLPRPQKTQIAPMIPDYLLDRMQAVQKRAQELESTLIDAAAKQGRSIEYQDIHTVVLYYLIAELQDKVDDLSQQIADQDFLESEGLV